MTLLSTSSPRIIPRGLPLVRQPDRVQADHGTFSRLWSWVKPVAVTIAVNEPTDRGAAA